MMKYIKYIALGILFGVTLTKAEIISWYRIYEMFMFQSFHMYGVIGSAVVVGIVFNQYIRRTKMRSISGERIIIPPKPFSVPRYLIGGILFGLGWALTGACPGPMFILLGNGVWVISVAILSGLAGTYVYGLVRHKLPH